MGANNILYHSTQGVKDGVMVQLSGQIKELLEMTEEHKFKLEEGYRKS